MAVTCPRCGGLIADAVDGRAGCGYCFPPYCPKCGRILVKEGELSMTCPPCDGPKAGTRARWLRGDRVTPGRWLAVYIEKIEDET